MDSGFLKRNSYQMNEQCVLIRCHAPTRIQLARWRSWAQHSSIYLSVDTTAWTLVTIAQFQTEWSNVFKNVHMYCQKDLLYTFPQLQEILDMIHKVAPKLQCGSLAWGLHVECILLWYAATQPQYAHVWVLEEDVGVVGGVHTLLADYARDHNSDLITHLPSINNVSPGWMWHGVSLDGFKVNVVKKIQGYEHAQRLSQRFIHYLQTCASNGWSAWSEMATPSLCLQGGFIMSALHKCHRRFYNPFRRISKAEWTGALCGQPIGTICHGLKF